MGNHRFKLSDMMPNAWFYKLRDMSKVRSQNAKSMQSSTPNPCRKSFYYYTSGPGPDPESTRMDTKLCFSPRNPNFYDSRFPHHPPPSSTNKRPKRNTVYMPSPRKMAQIPARLKPGPTSPHRPDFSDDSFHDGPHQSYLSPCSCHLSSSASDIIIDVDDTSYSAIHLDSLTQFNMLSEAGLPPIHTKPPKHAFSLQDSFVFHNASIAFPVEKPKRSRRSSTSPGSRKSFSGGVKLRGGGRKLSGKKPEGRRRKNVHEEGKKGKFYSESFAIVKASFDPEKDFKESMMEMIVENNIRESKDLEELLACYLSLNSNQYHDLIIKAFEQIWFSMAQLQF